MNYEQCLENVKELQLYTLKLEAENKVLKDRIKVLSVLLESNYQNKLFPRKK